MSNKRGLKTIKERSVLLKCQKRMLKNVRALRKLFASYKNVTETMNLNKSSKILLQSRTKKLTNSYLPRKINSLT